MGALVKAVLACAAVVLVGVWAVSSHTASLNAAAGVDVLGPFGPTSDVASQPSDSVCIEARVERFHWHFRYPGRDGLSHKSRRGHGFPEARDLSLIHI